MTQIEWFLEKFILRMNPVDLLDFRSEIGRFTKYVLLTTLSGYKSILGCTAQGEFKRKKRKSRIKEQFKCFCNGFSDIILCKGFKKLFQLSQENIAICKCHYYYFQT